MPTNTIRFDRMLRAMPERIYRAFLDDDAMAKRYETRITELLVSFNKLRQVNTDRSKKATRAVSIIDALYGKDSMQLRELRGLTKELRRQRHC